MFANFKALVGAGHVRRDRAQMKDFQLLQPADSRPPPSPASRAGSQTREKQTEHIHYPYSDPK